MTLELRQVTVARATGSVISDVSLDVVPGRVTALVGPNGAGKTTLLEAISGVLPTSNGTIRIDGMELTTRTRRDRYRAGVVHVEQGRAVFGSLTTVENIRLAGANASDLERALAFFPELEPRRDSPTHLLSGGEQQMVVLARSIAARPRFLLIDEMSLGLAPAVFMRLLPLVSELAGDGVGVLLVEQFTHLALEIADQALVVSGGRVRWSGPAEHLRADPDLLHRTYLGDGAEHARPSHPER